MASALTTAMRAININGSSQESANSPSLRQKVPKLTLRPTFSSNPNPIPPPSSHHLPTTSTSPTILSRTLKTARSGSHSSARSPPTGSTIEYASSAPLPPSSSSHAQNGTEDEDVPTHLYGRLPRHVLVKDERGREVPDYLKMILMCKFGRTLE